MIAFMAGHVSHASHRTRGSILFIIKLDILQYKNTINNYFTKITVQHSLLGHQVHLWNVYLTGTTQSFLLK